MPSVLVAGGANGIGRAVVRAFRQQGDAVLIADRDGVGAKAVATEDLPGPAEVFVGDLVDPDACRDAVAVAVDHGGGLDVLFANAAVLLARPLPDWTVADWDRSLAVNLRAPFLLTQAALPHLRESAVPRVVITSSTGGLRGHAGMPAYHASKAGVINLVRALADELGPHGITVNAVCPGWIDTPFNDSFWNHQDDPAAALARLEESIPLRRQGVPEDVVGSVLFLASPAASYVTGHALVVDGGYSAV